MKPRFANAFGVARNAGRDGRAVEPRLDFMPQYMEGEARDEMH